MRDEAAGAEGFIGFVRDQETADTLREAMAGAFPRGFDLRIVPFRGAVAALQAMPTPRIVLVDLSGEEQALSAMLDLAEVVEPGTIVLATGDQRDVSFYRSVTRGIGVREYLPKPLTKAAIGAHFLRWVRGAGAEADIRRSGRSIAVAGARGGVGASMIAANLAWLIGTEMHRHTVLVDADLHTGTAALHLGTPASLGLRTAIEAPDRIDPLLIERAAQQAGERLHVLAAEEGLQERPGYAAAAGQALSEALRHRYNFVIADISPKPLPFPRDLLEGANLRVFVTDPSLVGLRNLERLLALPAGPLQARAPILVLNQAGRPGGIPAAQAARDIGLAFDIVIPDLPRLLGRAAQFGEPATARRGAFRDALLRLAELVGAGSAPGPGAGSAAEAASARLPASFMPASLMPASFAPTSFTLASFAPANLIPASFAPARSGAPRTARA